MAIISGVAFTWAARVVGHEVMWKSRPGHLLLFYHCVLIVYEHIYDMEQQNAFHLCENGWFSQTWSHYYIAVGLL